MARAAAASDPYAPRHGDGGYAVAHYELRLAYRVATNRLEATARITAEALTALDRIRLDLSGLRAAKVRVDGRKARFTQTPHHLTVTVDPPLAAGARVEVDVEYAGSPKPRRSPWGALGWEELTDGVIVAAQPTGASTWFPCNDRPSDRAAYDIHVTTEAAYTVVANGVLVGSTPKGGLRTWHYRQPEPTASYLATVQIGRYATTPLDLDGVPGTLVYPAPLGVRVRHDFAELDAMMRLFQRRFGPYPFERYAVVVTDDELEIPLEAQSLAIFGENHARGDGAAERLVAHELAHQWFGNSLGLARWSDIWLNEGLACYAEWLWSEESGGLTAAELAHHHHRLLIAQPQDLVVADPGAADMFDDRVYKRGALAVHALRSELGDAAFFELLRAWCTRFRHELVTAADFAALADEVAGRPVAGVLTPWLDETAVPPLRRRGR